MVYIRDVADEKGWATKRLRFGKEYKGICIISQGLAGFQQDVAAEEGSEGMEEDTTEFMVVTSGGSWRQ